MKIFIRPRSVIGRALAGTACALLLTAPAHATDGQRRGFLIGFAVGAVDTDISVEPDTRFRYTEGSATGVAAKLTIGGGFTDRLALSGTLMQTLTTIRGNTHTTHLLGLTGTFWLRPGRGSAYGSITIARQNLRADIFRLREEFSDSESTDGNALRLAAGYEFRNGMLLEAAWTGYETGGYTHDGADLSLNQLQLMVGWHWY